MKHMAIVFAVAVLFSGCISQENALQETPSPTVLSSGDEVKPTLPPGYESMLFYGTLSSLSIDGNTATFAIAYDANNCEGAEGQITVTSAFAGASTPANDGFTDVSELRQGDAYLFSFYRNRPEDPWNEPVIYSSGLQYCAAFHGADLFIDQLLEEKTSSNGGPIEIVSPIIPVNQPTPLTIEVINRQDIPMTFTFTDAALIDEYVALPWANAWETPPYEERVAAARMNSCTVTFPAAPQTIPAGSRMPVTFTVTCSEPLVCRNPFTGQPAADGERDFCSFYLWGVFSFTDEFGFVHTIPSTSSPEMKGILKQLVKIQ